MNQVSDRSQKQIRTMRNVNDVFMSILRWSTHACFIQTCSFPFIEITSRFADLIPVSSTVYPELEMPGKDDITAEMDIQYKKAYYNLYKKKFNAKFEKADTLLTDKKKFNKSGEKDEKKKTKKWTN